MDSMVAQRIASMDDFQVVRFFQYWSMSLCNGAEIEFQDIVDGIPPVLREQAGISSALALDPDAAMESLPFADAVRVARETLGQLARSAEMAPSIRSALDSMQDDKLVVDVILSIGLVATVLLIVSTVEFKGKIGSFRVEKKKVDPELLASLGEFLGGLLAPFATPDGTGRRGGS